MKTGDRIPHFEVTALGGARVRYADLWQLKNIVLVALLPDDAASAEYASAIEDHRAELTQHDTACVVTFEPMPGIERPSVVIADRWGEVQFASEAARAGDLAPVDELLEWLHWVHHQCPECQGEAK